MAALHLVVETTLDLRVDIHGALTESGLQLQCNVLLLGLHQQQGTVGAPLLLLLGLDGIGEDLQLSLAALLPLGFDFLWEKQVLFVLVSEIY